MTAERDKKRSYLVFRLVAAVCSVAFVVWTLLISTREVVVDGSSGVVKSSKNTDLELATLTSHFVIKPASNDILEAELGARRLNYDLFDIPWNDLIIPCVALALVSVEDVRGFYFGAEYRGDLQLTCTGLNCGFTTATMDFDVFERNIDEEIYHGTFVVCQFFYQSPNCCRSHYCFSFLVKM